MFDQEIQNSFYQSGFKLKGTQIFIISLMQKGPSDQDLKTVSNTFITLLKEYESSKQWQQIDDKPVTVSRIQREDRVVSKAQVTINLPFEILAKFFDDASFVKKIDSRVLEFEILHKHLQFSVFHAHMQGFAIVSDREIVAVFTYQREGNKVYFGNRSCEFPCNSYKGTVRAFAYCGGTILEKTGENTTKMINIMDLDLSGSIPDFVKNKMATMRASAMTELEGKIKATLK